MGDVISMRRIGTSVAVVAAVGIWMTAGPAEQATFGQGAALQPVQQPAGPVKKFPYPAVRNQGNAIPPGPKVPPYNSPPLGEGPWAMETYEQRTIRVSVVTKGLTAPWGVAFLPPAASGGDNVILITEKAGRLRVHSERRPRADAGPRHSCGPVAGNDGRTDGHRPPPAVRPEQVDLHLLSQARSAAESVPTRGKATIASNSILRGTWDGKALTDIKDIFVADDVDMEVSRLAFGADGMLYMSIGGPGTGGEDSVIRPQHTNDYAGKILRMRDDGSVPPDNPFAGKKDYKERIFSMGHRNQLGLAMNPWTKEIWSGEQGPNGGDEINIIRAGKNYGWPLVSDGRDYRGPYISPSPYKEGMERPHVVFVPSIAISSIAFYTGDRFPNWKRNLFVSGMREGEIARTGQLIRIVMNDNWEEMRRESLLRDLHQRIRQVVQGPDGLIYAITDEGQNSVLLRIGDG